MPKPRINSSLVHGIKLEPPDLVKDKKFAVFLTHLFCRKHKKVRNNLKIYVKQYPRDLRKLFRRQLDKLEFHNCQPINLTPSEILGLYHQFNEILLAFQE